MEEGRTLSSTLSTLRTCRRARGHASLPQGSLAPVRVLLSRSLIAYYDPIRQSRGHAATSRQSRLYATPSLCGSASATRGTFPTSAAGLSARAAVPTPVGPLRRPVSIGAAVPGFLDLAASRHPQPPSLPAMPDGLSDFGAATFALCCGPCVCQALLTGYDPMECRALLRAF